MNYSEAKPIFLLYSTNPFACYLEMVGLYHRLLQIYAQIYDSNHIPSENEELDYDHFCEFVESVHQATDLFWTENPTPLLRRCIELCQ